MPKVLASASNAGGRHQRGRRGSSTLSEINIIPLVDVMLVLLIIFMVAAPMLQRGLEVNLPVASRSESISSERLFVTVPLSFRQDTEVFLGEEGIRLEVLAERVRQSLVNNSDKQVFLRGDGGVELQELMTVLDILKSAGVENVGIVSRPPGER
jgi:biopolymer transport protein TolR